MIYFIQAGEDGPVKIGYTSDDDANKRLKHLQVGNHNELRLMAVQDGTPGNEAILQYRFMLNGDHIRGEWYVLSDELKCLIMTGRKHSTKDKTYENTPTMGDRIRRVYPKYQYETLNV